MPMGLNISPSFWQSYINAILECIQAENTEALIIHSIKEITHSKARTIIKSFTNEQT